MIYALVYYPAIDTERVEQLRRKYDPQSGLIAAHITIVFPVPESIGAQNLVSHIETVLHHWEPFPIYLKGLEKSWDEYLLLMLDTGSKELTELHEEMYTGVLADYRKAGLEFVPHVTLGVFTGDEGKYSEALKEAEGLELDYRRMLEKVSLVKINEEQKQIKGSREFML